MLPQEVDKPRDYILDQDILEIVRQGSIKRYERAGNIIRQKLGDLPELVVIDMGCSTGYGCHILRKSLCNDAQIIGIDKNKERLTLARKSYAKDNVRFVEADALTTIQKPQSSVSAITFFEVLEHIPNARDVFRIFHTLLSENGILLLSTPNGKHVTKAERVQKGHAQSYTQQELTELLRTSGFYVDHVYGQYRFLGLGVRALASSGDRSIQSRPSSGGVQRIINSFPFVASYLSDFTENSHLIPTAKSLYIVAHKS